MIYDTINPKIVSFICEEIKPYTRILDVGCATGKLGRELKAKYNCYIIGIEIDDLAAELAQNYYDNIIIIDLEELIDNKKRLALKDKFDFIIFGDILEHVTKPEVLLRDFQYLLNQEGFLIASIPNIANWMIRLKLLFGNFDYTGGILDPGHLRFFTYKTARRLLEEAGFKIIKVTNNNTTWLFKFFLGRIWMKMFAFQFVFKCKKLGNYSPIELNK